MSARLATMRPPGRRVVAVDGKTVRGARTADGTAPHLMACLDHGTGVVLAQAAVGSSAGQQQGNLPQALTHLALISAAFDLDRAVGA